MRTTILHLWFEITNMITRHKRIFEIFIEAGITLALFWQLWPIAISQLSEPNFVQWGPQVNLWTILEVISPAIAIAIMFIFWPIPEPGGGTEC